jgi:hypothetical protein
MIFCLRVKLRNTQCEQLFSALPRKRACRQWEVHSKSNIMRICPCIHCPAVQHSKRLVRVSLIANTGRTTSYKALQNSKIMIK